MWRASGGKMYEKVSLVILCQKKKGPEAKKLFESLGE
ncbi:hypothetical protein ANCDUO_20793 [Ancylostoma duodenale]|uniref:Uncharacterized protein n=1 Tax=Ancylostoma duodenale TaxID=51022 RepID=A0A0C2FR13_9BILA|nr:hypothetical protein ANCDUO_20793 [Ancylostoma duodenale]